MIKEKPGSNACKSLKHVPDGPEPPKRKICDLITHKLIPARGEGGFPFAITLFHIKFSFYFFKKR